MHTLLTGDAAFKVSLGVWRSIASFLSSSTGAQTCNGNAGSECSGSLFACQTMRIPVLLGRLTFCLDFGSHLQLCLQAAEMSRPCTLAHRWAGISAPSSTIACRCCC